MEKATDSWLLKCFLILVISIFITGINENLVMGQQKKISVSGRKLLMNGKSYQVRSGEIDFQRIPKAYWKRRLEMAKAMGLNTVATYVFWNDLERKKGNWNFKGINNLRKFVKDAGEVGLNVIMRPGPYVCGERDFGGLPPWLLHDPELKVRCMNPYYIQNVKEYVKRIAAQVRDLQNTNGGPIILWQIENEYGSYGNDRQYLETLVKLWHQNGINVPFFTADGAGKQNIEAGNLPGLMIGLDPGVNARQFERVRKWRPNVPIFCSEFYPGWLTHWREHWAKVGTKGVVKQINWFMTHHKSFNLYMFNGGTNFGFTTGANYGNKFEPDVTSYDYDAPLNEMGHPTPKYYAIRKAIQQRLPSGVSLPKVPGIPATIAIPPIHFNKSVSVLNALPASINIAQPRPMEELGEDDGYILYQTKLRGATHGLLKVLNIHDYATVFLDGKFIGTLDRSERRDTLSIPSTKDPHPTLDILVEAMGHINFGDHIIDRKGITKRVLLNHMVLMNWKAYKLPMSNSYLENLKFKNSSRGQHQGTFFKTSFHLNKTGDVYFDMSQWKKGFVWINGHNLGRYWNVGPQQRLFCPAPWLKKGENTIIVFDMLKKNPASITGKTSLE
ncbi:MAG TPA: beta-galactosidase [Balneolales bacterium]|nr:beta-galactosidase [Balneolales bacterium]